MFVVFGPPIGVAIALVLLSAFAAVGSDTSFFAALAERWVAMHPLQPGALYLAPFWGVAPALVAGLVVGWSEGWRGPITLFSGFLLGMGVGALFYMIGEFAGFAGAVYGASFSVAVCAAAIMVLVLAVRFVSWIVAKPSGDA
ncbi:MAG: hypothetical protein KI785_03905 [Devosiaceae bacterium]|nr:hypothetical protein [Devosiaceae bacterium MH13]